jgi:hypothetical protein
MKRDKNTNYSAKFKFSNEKFPYGHHNFNLLIGDRFWIQGKIIE